MDTPIPDPIAALAAALQDRYRIERELGRGGMAVVYLARDVRHDRQVAIKVLERPAGAGLGDERFRREIRIAAQLNHPHILPLHDSGEAAGLQYYVMPYVTGESLRDRLRRDGTLPVAEALRIAGEVADALDYAHRAGIVHRDIKPENIMLHEGHAVVADFGIARAVQESAETGITATGIVIGTPAYLSPEQVTGGDLDGRSDLYSLACVLFECLAGEPPFSGTAVAIMAQRVMGEAPSIRARRTDVDEALAGVLQRALATEPGGRFTTGQDLAAALRAPPPASGPPPLEGDRPSIVVLPFANLSPDPENEYFSDGLTEEIIADLSRVGALRVISRTSAMRLKGTDKDVQAIGRELGVRYVLEGSVRKAGGNLRISAQLIDAASDGHLWAEKYSGTMDEVFEVQERVARQIVEALDLTLSSDEDQRLRSRPIASVRAFELYLQARQALQRYDAATGMRLIRDAMAIEGATPPLQALEAWARVTQVRSGVAGGAQPLDEAEGTARAIIAAAPDTALGHAVLGMAAYERGRPAEAVRYFRAALAREPNDPDAFTYICAAYIGAGQNAAAEETSHRFLAVDPLSANAWMMAGVVLWFSGRYAIGLPSLRRAAEVDPDNLIGRWSLGYNEALVGNLGEAAGHAAFLQDRAPEVPYTRQLKALVAALAGRRAEALAELAVVDVTALDGHHRFHLAESYAMAGELETALGLLKQALDGGFHPQAFIAEHCPFLAPLRSLPGFAPLAARARELTAAFNAGEPNAV